MQAIYQFLGNTITNNTNCTILLKLQKLRQPTITDTPHSKHACNGLVHPVLGDIITMYQKLAEDPIMKDTWQEYMCVELGRLAQGYGKTERTSIVRFMTHNMIKSIPKDRTVTTERKRQTRTASTSQQEENLSSTLKKSQHVLQNSQLPKSFGTVSSAQGTLNTCA